uniref:Uncharacterized protein n=1 Tax=Arundo donax TaxID=35708 RepID=A0A0A9CPM0_ARUDO
MDSTFVDCNAWFAFRSFLEQSEKKVSFLLLLKASAPFA